MLSITVTEGKITDSYWFLPEMTQGMLAKFYWTKQITKMYLSSRMQKKPHNPIMSLEEKVN